MTPQAGAQNQINGDKPVIYTMRRLNQETARVINEVIEKNSPALISRLGRLVAVMTPVEENFESRVISEMAREIGTPAQGSSPQVNDENVEVYNIRQLGQQTAFIIEQIAKNGAAFITRNGSIAVMISPFDRKFESRVLSDMAREIGQRGLGSLPPLPT